MAGFKEGYVHQRLDRVGSLYKSQIVFSSVTLDVAEPRYICSVPKKALTNENQRQD